MFRNIMIPLDGSIFAEAILPLAGEVARRTGALLHVVVVHHGLDAERAGDMSATFLRQIEAQTLEEEKAYLFRTAADLRTTNGPRVADHLLEGPVVPTLQRYVKANGIDLVMMTTHGRGGFQRAWLGSVTDALVRSLPAPVLALHADGDEDGPALTKIRHVLAATDGSSIGDNAFRAALELCSVLDAECTLVRAVAPPLPAYPAFVGETIPYAGEESIERLGDEMISMVDYGAMARAAHVPLTTRVIVEARPADAILRAAGEANADLIVLGTHGRNPMARWLLGSIADKVVRSARVPVMVCPADTTFTVPAIVVHEEKEEVVEIC